MGDDAEDAIELSIAYEFMDDDEEYEAKAGPDCDPVDRYRRPFLPFGGGAQPKTCNRCGTGGLFWMKLPEGWRLHSAAGIHVCQRKPSEEPRER